MVLIYINNCLFTNKEIKQIKNHYVILYKILIFAVTNSHLECYFTAPLTGAIALQLPSHKNAQRFAFLFGRVREVVRSESLPCYFIIIGRI